MMSLHYQLYPLENPLNLCSKEYVQECSLQCKGIIAPNQSSSDPLPEDWIRGRFTAALQQRKGKRNEL